MTAQDFARWVARQGVDEVDRLRRLVAGDVFAGEVDDVGRFTGAITTLAFIAPSRSST